MGKHVSVWIDTGAPSTPMASDAIRADVIVIGAGMTGVLTSLELLRRGQKVLLVDPRAPGRGTTGHTTGKITSQHSVVYQDLLSTFGEDKARMYAEANEWAVGAYADLIEREGIDCDFTRQTAYLYTEDEDEQKTLHEECEAARRAGINAVLEKPPLEFIRFDALAFPNQAQLHSGKFIEGAMRVFSREGGMFRQERVTSIEATEGFAKVKSSAAELEAGAVVTATLYPIDDYLLFATRMVPTQHHGTAFRVRNAPIQGMYLRVEEPTFSLRWTEADGGLLICVGKSQKVGKIEEDPYAALAAYAAERFDIVEERYRWSAHDQHTPDKVPYIGRYGRDKEGHFTATGFRAWGLTHAMVASRLLSDLIEGRENPWSTLYDPLRIKPTKTAKTMAKQTASALKHLVLERLRGTEPIEKLRPGEAATVREDGQRLGAYRDDTGTVHFVSLACPHMGCVVQWDPFDRTWSCPCHGSRFNYRGEVLYGPATKGIGVE